MQYQYIQIFLMFLCCGELTQTQKQGDHVIQVTQKLPQQLLVSQQGHKLKGFIPAMKKRTSIFGIPTNNNQAKQSYNNNKNNSIFNFLQQNSQQFNDFIVKKLMKSNYQILKEEYKRGYQSWIDNDFPPQQRSFGLQRQTEKVNWKRIGQIIKNPVFIQNKADPQDILQGRIGNCYFLSAICGLAQDQSRILSLFPNLQINPNGIYMARILHKGVLKEIVVDDYFPVSKKDGKLVCSQPAGGNQIWVLILQKCWAKLFGSYEAIDGGLPNEVLRAFSGAPIYQYITNQLSSDQTEDLFNKMIQSDARHHVICCGTYSDQSVQEHGLVLGHAYTILNVYSKPYRLLKIRNPWGERQWNGRASEYDKNFWKSISSYDKKRLGHADQDNGVFFMIWQDFLQHFLIVNICKIQNQANYYYQQLTYPKGKGQFNQFTTKGGDVTVQISQQSTRGLNVPKPRYATSTIIVAKKIKNRYNIQDYEYHSDFSARNACYVNLQLPDLDQGQYIIYSALNGRNYSEDATLSCYSQTPLQLFHLQIKEEDFLHRIYLDHARKNVQNHQKIFGNQDVWVCMDILYDSGFAYTVIHIGPGIQLKLGLTFNQEQYRDNNFELMLPYKGQGIFKVVCNSGQDSIVLCRIIPQTYAIEASLPIPNIKKLF